VPSPDRGRALDHVVVVMFEYRSFDYLLGRLYEPGEVASFKGVIGKELRKRVFPTHSRRLLILTMTTA
jgi:phospholipase C